MLILDQIRKADAPLRNLSLLFLAGLMVLLSGLWYVQIQSGRKYQASHENQATRTVRLPSIRGRIFDRNGYVIAENRPNFVLNLYLDTLRPVFDQTYSSLRSRWTTQHPGARFTRESSDQLKQLARILVASNSFQTVSSLLQSPAGFDERRFLQHYERRRSYPLPLFHNLAPDQIARFLEQSSRIVGVDLEIQPQRFYPRGSTAAHLLGQLRREAGSEEEDDESFDYRLPDFQGIIGIEGALDPFLRGHHGVKAVVINNVLYRHSETLLEAPRPGQDVGLTIDLQLQAAVESALQAASPTLRGAAIVLDVRNGDVLSLASAPAYDPNLFVQNISPEDWEKLSDPKMTPQINRATYGAYNPGSIFKIITALAALEAGQLNPSELISSPGYYMLGRRRINDTAPPGEYDFRRAFKKSSNTYFIHYGLKTGIERILEMGHRFHLGEKTGLPVNQEVKSYFPTREEILGTWSPGNFANVSIGQEITLTPIQVAVMVAAVANGGKVWWPRLVSHLESDPQNPASQNLPITQAASLRSDLHVRPENLAIVREAMRADVLDPDGTGHPADVPGMEVCGKTGTAQVTQGHHVIDHITWFASFAPYSSPRYAVIVMVESGGSGGGTCAPIARKIYQALQTADTRLATAPASAPR